MQTTFKATIYFAITFFMAHPTLAETNAILDNRSQIEILKNRLAVLENQVKKEKNSEQNSDDVMVTLKPSPSFKTRDGKTTFNLNGRMMIDAGIIAKGKSSAIDHSSSVRVLWLGATGKINQNWSYNSLIGFENNKTSVLNAFLQYSGLSNADILIGNFFENNGIEAGTFNLINPFMERSSGITTFRQLRRTGVSYNPYGQNWGGHFGVFGSGPNNSSSSDAKGQGVSGRAHYALINDKAHAHFLHLGFNSTYRTPDSATKTMRFNSAGDSKVINGILVDTGDISNVDNYYQNMAELRYQKGSLTITSEYVRTNINRIGLQNLEFNGGYVTASYFVTGEKYGYSVKTGAPSAAGINANAWEIATRYSMTDLNNKDIRGGKLQSYDVGVNYYPNRHLKFMANYIANTMDSHAAVQQDNSHYLLFRAQVSF